MTLRIVVATRLYTPEIGAAAFRLQALVDALQGSGAVVKVLTTKPPLPDTGTMSSNANVRRWPVLRDKGGNVRGYVQYMSFDVPLLFRLLFTKADVVVSEPPPTTGVVVAVSSWLRRRPYVYYAADVWTDALAATNAPRPVVQLMRAFETLALRRAAMIIAISDGVAERLMTFNVDQNSITVINNGIDTTVFKTAGQVVRRDYPYFVYTGTMSEWQGADIYIRALSKVREEYPCAKIFFFGGGSHVDDLKQLAGRLAPANVEFGGVISPSRTAEWIRGAHASLVSIVPGQGYDFAKPTKIYAAAACGTPVVFAGVGEAARIIKDNALGTVADFTEESVAEAMLQILRCNNHRKTTGFEWVEANASLLRTGSRAAACVLEVNSFEGDC